ncbi:MAG: LamG domain-containing protein [Candidatus Poribacteria bacterium]|nr:LamG domain-containing protein [Candidatus Poribacteria bacterium]MDP6749433.1 LamG domain-containing protein [Candidatus Poribacteria bacterium]MDP6999100.1 LamG domain-containing protein [Candidatus Poribacteria bacterium]
MTRFTISIISFMVFVSILVEQSSAKVEPGAVLGIWLLDENKGGVATDSSKNGRDGKMTGSLKVVKAKFDQGFEFEGKLNNYVSVPHDKSLNLEKFTITYWCQMGGSGKWQIPVQKVDNAAGGSHRNVDFQTPPAGGNVSVYFSQGANQWRGANGKTEVSDEKWHHTAGSYDGKKLLLYVDGVQEAEGSHKGKPDFMDDPLMLGGGRLWPFKGIIDDIGLFNKALSIDEIKTIMKEGLSSMLAVSPSGQLTLTWAEIKK